MEGGGGGCSVITDGGFARVEGCSLAVNNAHVPPNYQLRTASTLVSFNSRAEASYRPRGDGGSISGLLGVYLGDPSPSCAKVAPRSGDEGPALPDSTIDVR
jgi:hypothetical protein